jgi:sugar/nucleoside kinase (ribokinase family)
MTGPAGFPGPASPGDRRLVGLASVLVDLTVRVPALPARGGDVLGADGGHAAGGGINALATAARLGLRAAYAGRHGTGPSGDAVRRDLAREGITVLRPPEPGADTGTCLVLLEPDGERTFVTVPGVEAVQDRDALAGVGLLPGDALYASGYDLAYPGSGPALSSWLAALPRRADGGPWLLLDPGPLAAQIPREALAAVLRRADAVSLSAAEQAPLGGGEEPVPGLPPDAVVVLRRGADGATVTAPGLTLDVPGRPAPGPVVDSNGAGDVHTGALVAALARGLGWPGALAVAAAAAAWSVTRRGASTGPDPRELAAAFPEAAALLRAAAPH